MQARAAILLERELQEATPTRQGGQMHAGHTIGSRLLVAITVAAVGVLVAGPPASARVRIPEQPNALGKRVAKSTTRVQSRSREIVSLGQDSYSGLALFVVKVDGQVVGMPFG